MIERFRIQAIPSWQCNNYDFRKAAPFGEKCQYCNLYSEMKSANTIVTFGKKSIPITQEMTPSQWAKGMHRVRVASGLSVLYDFTGGEPTLYADLPQLLEKTRSYGEWAITSNSQLRKQIEAIFKARIDMPSSWTSSWHPLANYPIEKFIDNISFIRSFGIYTSVTIVLHESTKATIKDDLRRFQDAGFVTQIHIALIDGEDFNDSNADLLALYDELKHLNRSFAESMDGTPDGVPTPRNCVAGYRSVVVSSDGKCYLCYEHAMRQSMESIGQWGEWMPKTDLTRNCSWPCSFSCDLRLVQGVDAKLWMGAAAL